MIQPYKHTSFYINSCHDRKREILAKLHSKFKVKADISSFMQLIKNLEQFQQSNEYGPTF